MDFDGATDAGAGVVDVTMTGDQGPTGPVGGAGSPGPTGPQGPQAQGLDALVTFEESSSLFGHQALGPSVTYSHTFNFSASLSQILMLTGGVSEWGKTNDGFIIDNNDYFDITNIERLSATEGRISARVPDTIHSLTLVRLYLTAGGY